MNQVQLNALGGQRLRLAERLFAKRRINSQTDMLGVAGPPRPPRLRPDHHRLPPLLGPPALGHALSRLRPRKPAPDPAPRHNPACFPPRAPTRPGTPEQNLRDRQQRLAATVRSGADRAAKTAVRMRARRVSLPPAADDEDDARPVLPLAACCRRPRDDKPIGDALQRHRPHATETERPRPCPAFRRRSRTRLSNSRFSG
jgi:hypothetical protein